MTQTELNARSSVASDLYKEGKITRPEAFRLELDAMLGKNSGPIEFEDNNDHEFMMSGEGLDHDEYRQRMFLSNF